MNRIQQIKQEVDAHYELTNVENLDYSQFQDVLTDRIRKVRQAIVPRNEIEEFDEDDMVEREWRHGETAIRYYKWPLEGVDLVAHTRHSLEKDSKGLDVVIFRGFAHDVALACFIMDLHVLEVQESWRRITEAGGLRGITRSQKVERHRVHMRDRCQALVSFLGERALELETQAMEDERYEEMVYLKMDIIDAEISRAA